MAHLTLNNSKLFLANNNMHTIKAGSHYNEITHNGHANFITVESGNHDNSFKNGGPGDLVNVASDTRTEFTSPVGQRSNVGIIGANATVSAVRQNIENAPNLQNLVLEGTDNTFYLGYGSSLKVTGWQNLIHAHGWTQTHFFGSDNTLGASLGGSNTLTLEVNRTHTVQGLVDRVYFNLPQTGTATTTLNTSSNRIDYVRAPTPSTPPVFTFNINGTNNQSTINNGGLSRLDIIHQGTGNKIQGNVIPSGQLYRSDPAAVSWGTTIVTTWYWWPSMVYISHTTTNDPFILDFTGRKVATQSLANSIASYDFEDNGKLIRTAWGLPGQGYLIHKKNNASTSIEKGELIEGLQHLRDVVGSDVAVLDKSHREWTKLRIWIDVEGAGNANNAKLQPLEEVGIASINLDSAILAARDDNGNTVLGEGTFTMVNGDVRNWAGVNLRFEP